MVPTDRLPAGKQPCSKEVIIFYNLKMSGQVVVLLKPTCEGAQQPDSIRVVFWKVCNV